MIVTTNSAGSLYTTTSKFGNSGTEYTTTWTTTNSDGSVETDSGVVIVTNSLSFSTGYIGSKEWKSDATVVYPDFGHYTSTWTTTLVEGKTTTICGEVDVTLDVYGHTITLVSIPLKGHTVTLTTTDVIGKTVTYCAVAHLTTDDAGKVYTTTAVLESNETSGTYTTTDVHGLTVTVAAGAVEKGTSTSTSTEAGNSGTTSTTNVDKTLFTTDSLGNVALQTIVGSVLQETSIRTLITLSQSSSIVGANSASASEIVGAGSTKQISIGMALSLVLLAVI